MTFGNLAQQREREIAKNGASSSVLKEGAGVADMVSLERVKSILQYLLFLKINSPLYGR